MITLWQIRSLLEWGFWKPFLYVEDPQIVLDESQLGNLKVDRSLPVYRFYRIDRGGEREFVTKRHGAVLVAVTKEQYRGWQKRTWIAKRVVSLGI